MAQVFTLLGLLAVGRFVIATNTTTKQPLFPYEEVVLTDQELEKLAETSEYGSLFQFDNGTAPDPDRLKSGACKAFPGDAEWPAQEVWHTFNELVDGAIIDTVPVAAPCYENTGLYDAGKCAEIQENFIDPYFHENDPTSIFWPLYQGRTCMPTDDPDAGECTHGGYPIYALNVSSVRQIQLAVNFARETNVRLVIKNTGHDYLGKSSGAGALSIWTHNLKNLVYYPALDIPGYQGPAIKVGAGVTVREVYKKAHENNVSALGGICESVGYAGGYVAGGGHTPLSGLHGMAADHVMALEVVTADGRYVTASPEENTDLYWALRGGGGGTFGVVTSVIIRVHPKVPVVTSTFSFGTSGNVSADAFWEAMRTYFELFIPFTDAGTYSWFQVTSTNGSYELLMKPFFAPNHTIESFNQVVKPWFDRISELGIPFSPNTTQHEAFYPAYDSTWGSDVLLNGAGRVSMPGNWLFPRGNWEDAAKFNATFAAIRKHSEGGRRLLGYHQAPRNRANVDNAVNSAFRHVICFLILSVVFPSTDPTPAQVKDASDELINEIMAPFREIAPESEGGGAYLNEANVDAPDWQDAFYGIHYPRLLQLKEEYDPKHVFYATTAVGSEGWEVRDGDQGTKTQNGKLCRL